MIAAPNLIEEHLGFHGSSSHRSVLGGRVFIDAEGLDERTVQQRSLSASDVELRRTRSRRTGTIVDTREHHYQITYDLRRESFPWLCFSTCNVSFSREAYELAGGFNAKFSGWGYEDNEFGFRLFKRDPGHRIIPHIRALAYHQEHERNTRQMGFDEQRNLRIFLQSIKDYVAAERQ